jgi:tRNA threonylcarbamoyladenosine biosynthesis protein TsaB
MSLILNIDTALDKASVSLSNEGKVLGLSSSENQKEHASWLHTAIAELLQKNELKVNDLQAVAVSIGPGSYTSLRVGLSAAKGFCFALNIPLITVSSLKILAYAVKSEAIDMICSLIDARRMEVFAAVYDKELQEKISPHALVVDEKSFADILLKGDVLFCGNGIHKLSARPGGQTLISYNNARFSNTIADASHLAHLSLKYYNNKDFADLAYAEPLYLKEFFNASGKTK